MSDEIENLKQKKELLEEILGNQNKLSEELAKYFKQFQISTDDSLESAEQYKVKIQELIAAAVSKNELSEEELQSLSNINVLLQEGVKIGDDKLEIDEQSNNLLRQAINLRKEDFSIQTQAYIQSGKRLNVLKSAKASIEEASKLSRADSAFALAGLAKEVLLRSKIASLAMNTLTTITALSAELNKLTLDGERYASIAIGAADRVAGVSYVEAKEAQVELIQGMSLFTRMNEELQKDLVATTAQFEKLGISNRNQVMMNQVATKAFSMSAKEATRFYSELVTFSKDTKISMTEIDRNLASIGDKLSLFGRENYQQVFKDLSAAAKDFGIEASRMLEVTEQFTTFEGAAQAAGRLNAILGGNFISGMGLMTASLENPVDVFRQLKTGMEMSGKEFANLGQAQKRYVAERLGMSLTEAESTFANSLEEGTQKLKQRQATQEELDKLSAKSTEVFQRLQIAMMKIANSPLVGYIVDTIETIANLIEESKEAENGFGAFFSSLLSGAVIISLLAKGLSFLFGPTTLLGKGFIYLKGAIFGKTAATVADNATTPATVASDNAKTASLQKYTAALEMNNKAIGRNIAAQMNMQKAGIKTAGTGALLGAGFAKMAIGIGIAIAALGVLGYLLVENRKATAEQMKADAALEAAKAKQAETFAEFGKIVKDITIFANLKLFAAGITEISKAINTINLDKVSALSSIATNPIDISTAPAATVGTQVVPVKVVEVEMQTTIEEERQQMSLANRGREESKEVSLVINSPINLDGANWGTLISNGIAMYTDRSEGGRLTPNMTGETGSSLLRYKRR